MHRISLSLFACVASCALAINNAPASVHSAHIAAAPLVATRAASSPRAPISRSNSASHRQARALTRAARKARKTSKDKPVNPTPARAIVYKTLNKNFAAAQKVEQADVNARAERLYRASQFSAPIIIDAKACKRVGTHGESIYENC